MVIHRYGIIPKLIATTSASISIVRVYDCLLDLSHTEWSVPRLSKQCYLNLVLMSCSDTQIWQANSHSTGYGMKDHLVFMQAQLMWTWCQVAVSVYAHISHCNRQGIVSSNANDLGGWNVCKAHKMIITLTKKGKKNPNFSNRCKEWNNWIFFCLNH